VELVSFLQWVQKNVPDVQVKIPKNRQVMILAVVAIATSYFFYLDIRI